ncbi:MAG: HD domain-containing phosphohydrolase [Spirochaetota bacterium]
MKILVADDDQSTRFILKTQLQSWGYEVVLCDNGAKALEYLTSNDPPRIAILDWMMGEYTGTEICRIINNRSPMIYTILLTAKTSEDDLVEAIASGAHCFQSKPVSPAVLKSLTEVGRRLITAEDKLKTQEAEVRFQCYGALADLAEARHNYTGTHMRRISKYSRLLAEKLGLPGDQCHDIELYSTFHDVGKVGIPDLILLSKSSFTQDERDVMQTHTIIGYEILSSVPTLQLAANIARSHHERWDGTGYPDGLSREDIPIEARVVSIVDVYDALRTKRSYKESWSHQQALTYLNEQSGSSFDPTIISVFNEYHQEFDAIFTANPD